MVRFGFAEGDVDFYPTGPHEEYTQFVGAIDQRSDVWVCLRDRTAVGSWVVKRQSELAVALENGTPELLVG